MIFTNMAYPGKDYRVQVFDAWLGETFEPMDNPKNGDKIVKRELGEDGQPVVSETKVYSNGSWVDEGGGGGGGGDYKTANVTLIPYNENDSVYLYAWTNDDGSYQGMFCNGDGFMSEVHTTEAGQVETVFVLYGDTAMCSLYGTYKSSTGSVVYDEGENAVTISGDCTITLEATD